MCISSYLIYLGLLGIVKIAFGGGYPSATTTLPLISFHLLGVIFLLGSGWTLCGIHEPARGGKPWLNSNQGSE